MSTLFAEKESGVVVCLHGFMGAPWNMWYLSGSLEEKGWNALNWKYKSRDFSIEAHGSRLAKELVFLSSENPGQPIHFVAHSMGGLVLLSALNHERCPEEAKIGKVILIAPPIKGTAWGRWLGQFSIARWLAKDLSGKELMTKATFEDLGRYPDSCKILVIAGTLGFNPLINGLNDGTVAVDETKIEGAHERVLVRRGHKNIVFSQEVSKYVQNFLEK